MFDKKYYYLLIFFFILINCKTNVIQNKKHTNHIISFYKKKIKKDKIRNNSFKNKLKQKKIKPKDSIASKKSKSKRLKNNNKSKKYFYRASSLKTILIKHPYYSQIGKKKGWVTYIYNAKIYHGSTVLSAPVFELVGKNQEIIYANKSIYYLDKRTNTVLTALRAIYYKNDEKLVLIRKPKIIKIFDKNKKEKLIIIADKMIRDGKSKTSIATGNIQVRKNKLKIFCEKSIFNENKNILRLIDSPRVMKEKNSIVSDTMKYFVQEDKIIFNNNAKLIFYSKQKEKKEEKNIVIADYAEYFTKKEKIILKKVVNPIKILNSNMKTVSDYLIIQGQKPDQIYLKNNVTTYLKRENLFIISENILVDFQKNIIVTKKYNKKDSFIIFFNKKNKMTSYFSSEYTIISRLRDKNQIYHARGNLKIILLNENKFIKNKIFTLSKKQLLNLSKKIIISGQWLEGNSNQSIQIYGKPNLLYVEKNKKIFLRKIILFLKSNQFILLGKIKSNL